MDAYGWLGDRHDPATIAYLEAENAYTEAATAHLAESLRGDGLTGLRVLPARRRGPDGTVR